MQMDKPTPEELKVLEDLMDHLQGKMQLGHDDLSERLGRKKPDLEIVKVGVGADPMEGSPEEEKGESPDMEAKEDMMGQGDDDMMSPEEKLKQRLMKLRA